MEYPSKTSFPGTDYEDAAPEWGTFDGENLVTLGFPDYKGEPQIKHITKDTAIRLARIIYATFDKTDFIPKKK